MLTRDLFRPALIAATAIALAAPVAGAFGIGLQPTTVEMEVEPGDRSRQVVTLANVHTEKTISLTLGLADWTLDETGQIELAPPGESTESAAEWVRFSPAFVTLEPGESEQIVVDMATPARLQRNGDFRFALLASTVLPEERGGQSGVWRKYQIASLFYLTAGDADSVPVVTASGVSLDDSGEAGIDLHIENTGNAHARLEGTIQIASDNADPQIIPISNLVVLNDGKRIYRTPLTMPLPETAEIEVRLDNIFAPQSEGAVQALPALTIPATVRKAEVPATPVDQTTIE